MQINEIVNNVMKLYRVFGEMLENGMNPKKAWQKLSSQKGSIAREASKSIYEFPVLCSDSCSYELARAVTDSVQARCAVYTKIVFERIGLVKVMEGETKDQMISKLKGYSFKMDEDAENDGPIPGTLPLLREWHGTPLPDIGLNMGTVDGGVIHEGKKTVSKGPRMTDGQYDPQAMSEKEYNVYLGRRREEIAALEHKKLEIEELKVKDHPKMGKTVADIIPDKRRSNPTTLKVTIEYATPNNVTVTSFTVGVKAILHPIPSNELVKFVPKAKFDMSPIIRLAQLTTGEISFVSDFLLGLDLIKKDVSGKKAAGSGAWYAKLKNLTRENRVDKVVNVGRGSMPTATIVVSMDDVDEMLRSTRGKFDLREPKAAKMIVRSLSLMGLVITDEANERVWWYEDTHRGYAFYSIKDLKAENKGMSEKDLLKVLIAVNK